jgi:S-adenosyl methyltransferase
MTDSSPARGSKIDTTVPHSARVWNYWLGGKDNYPVDREMGDQIMAMVPDMPRIAGHPVPRAGRRAPHVWNRV